MSATQKDSARDGLEGVVVAETRLSEVDGLKGRLIIAGHDVEELAGRIPFEAACWLLAHGKLPSSAQIDEVQRALGAARANAFQNLPRIGDALRMGNDMEALRASTAHLSQGDSGAVDQSTELIAATAVFAAARTRTRAGKSPLAPDPTLEHAADYLRMALEHRPAKAAVDALNTYLVTVVDHGMNASTFAARVVASTSSDMVSAVVAAIGALKGPLHGGAPGPVLDMLQAIDSPSRARSWLEAELGKGHRIMGMGHRVYRVRDPRAAVLEKAIEQLSKAGLATERLTLARAVEKEAERLLQERHPERALRANVEFYTAVLLDAIGLPGTAFTPTFAVGRVAGWCAHYLEQQKAGRLIRPASRYIGPRPSERP